MSAPHDSSADRTSPRAKLFQPGTLVIDSDTRRIHLLDVSSGGARLYVLAPPPVGATVRITCDVPLGPARVVWVADRFVGVAFRVPLSDLTLARLLQSNSALRSKLAAAPKLTR